MTASRAGETYRSSRSGCVTSRRSSTPGARKWIEERYLKSTQVVGTPETIARRGLERAGAGPLAWGPHDTSLAPWLSRVRSPAMSPTSRWSLRGLCRRPISAPATDVLSVQR